MKNDKWGICDLKPKDEPKPSSKNYFLFLMIYKRLLLTVINFDDM